MQMETAAAVREIGSQNGKKYDVRFSMTLNLNVYKGSRLERYVLAGRAIWKDDDYIGYNSWAGKFNFTKDGCIVSPNKTAVKLTPRKVDYRANACIVWGFPSFKYHWKYENIYAKTVFTALTLKK